jgi:hypothetical protein
MSCPTACPISPGSTGFTITGGASDAAFTCAPPVPSGGTCSFTCGTDGSEPVEGTAPVCRANGWTFAWQNGPGGPPACQTVGEYVSLLLWKCWDHVDGITPPLCTYHGCPFVCANHASWWGINSLIQPSWACSCGDGGNM